MLRLDDTEVQDKAGAFFTDPGEIYYLFELDEPTEVNGKMASAVPRTETVDYIYLDVHNPRDPLDVDEVEALVDKHVHMRFIEGNLPFSTNPVSPEKAPSASEIMRVEEAS